MLEQYVFASNLQSSPPFEKLFALAYIFIFIKIKRGNNKVLIDSSEPQDKI